MKTVFEVIYFLNNNDSGNKTIWLCYDAFTDRYMGNVKYHTPFKLYCYFSDRTLPYNPAMLRNITDFVTQLNK